MGEGPVHRRNRLVFRETREKPLFPWWGSLTIFDDDAKISVSAQGRRRVWSVAVNAPRARAVQPPPGDSPQHLAHCVKEYCRVGTPHGGSPAPHPSW